MATITTDLICNLNQPVEATFLHGNMFSQDNAGNTINVYVLDNGEPATIGGTVSANVIRADGNTVAVSGAIEGNKAYVILPQACYAVPGRVEIIIKLTQNTTITTIAAIVANVYRSTTDTVVDPGTIIPSISSLIAEIEAAVDSIPVDYSGLLATIAADYSSSKTYPIVGMYAWQGGVLKRNIVPITTAETYTAAHWTDAVLGDDVTALKSAFNAATESTENNFEQLTGNRALVFKSGVYMTASTPSAGSVVSYNENTTFVCAICPCTKTDVFNVHVIGGSSGRRAYFFCDADMKALKYATSGLEVNGELVPPDNDNVRFLVVNNFLTSMASGYYAYKGENNIAHIDNVEKNIVRSLANDTGYVLLDWEQGNIDSNGESDSANYIRTGFYPFADGDEFYYDIADGYYFRVIGYSSAGVYQGNLGVVTGSGKFIVSGTNVTKVRFRMSNSDTSAITPNEGYKNATISVWDLHASVQALQTENDDVIEYSNLFIDGYAIDTRGTSVSFASPLSDSTYSYALVPCQEGDRFALLNYTYGTYAKVWCFIDAENNILSKADSISQSTRLVYEPQILTAPKNAAGLLVQHKNTGELGYKPKIIKLATNPTANMIALKNNIIPSVPSEAWKRKVVAVYEKYVCINDNGHLKFSNDCGHTWTGDLDVSSIGTLVNYHFFANGRLAFFSKTGAYYTDDFSTYSSATCYEADGTTVYTPSEQYNFDVAADVDVRKFINGVDMYVFGNYTLSSSSRKMVWYTKDRGETYRIAYEFGTGTNLQVRHVHIVYYYATNDVFIVCTGDSASTECRVLQFAYDTANDSWTVTVLGGSSRLYKWSYVDEWDGMIYYAYDNAPSAIKRCKFEDIGDESKHEVILDGIPNDLTCAVIGQNGDIIACSSSYRSLGGATDTATLPAVDCSRKLYYSTDRKSFTEIMLQPQLLSSYTVPFWFLPMTKDGHFIGNVWDDSKVVKGPSVYLDEYVRMAGFPKALQSW